MPPTPLETELATWTAAALVPTGQPERLVLLAASGRDCGKRLSGIA